MRRFALLGPVVLVLLVVYAVALGTRSGAAQPAVTAQRTTAVTSVSRSCPPPGPNAGRATIALASVPSSASAANKTPAGAATLSAVPSAAKAKAEAGTKTAATTVTTPDTAALVRAPQAADFDATQIDATGKMAEGLEAEQATSGGIGTVSCAHPGADMWFVGTGQDAGASTIELYLSNTGAMAATVDVTMLTDSGAQDGLDDGITVPAHQYLNLSLVPYVKGSTVLSVEVQVTFGQVAANVWEGSGSGGTWLPVAASPSTRLVLPGLTTAGSAAQLFVAVPGARDAEVKVTALTAQGKFLPFGTVAEDAPAAAASTFPLSSLGASASALVLTSNVPVTAGVLIPGSGIGSFTAAAAPVTGQGVVAASPASGGDTTGLILSAPGAAVRVSVQAYPSTSAERSLPAPPPVIYTVQAAHTLAVAIPVPKGDHGSFAIAVTPQRGSGPLYAARIVTSGGHNLSGTLLSLLPVPSALTSIQLPPARDTYTAVLP